ncbi:hypothetical protein TRIP_E150006 [uncultured Spirochaetota bacterium]|uniref:Uncharacterized protein n=1 Tax=uncultured Spirochaetota bacterium TaxID=460511 RepID=A0A652ZSJ2_9SPIR|nr:hypothetical protein TRIP_E150006 [uncultured Spirochaetota bacterium]
MFYTVSLNPLSIYTDISYIQNIMYLSSHVSLHNF